MPQTERKGWIDIARALAMIFVIFGHVGNETVAAVFFTKRIGSF